VSPDPVHTLRYYSSRQEIWRWYWRAWARGLWRYPVVLGLLAAGFEAERRGFSNLSASSLVGTAVLSALACMLVFALWPQIRFKPAERTLLVNPSGWTTTIGKVRGECAWHEIREIVESSGMICIVGTNGNSLLIPPRAFNTQEARHRFLADVRQWHQAATPERLG
jgi:hypothetical protein